MSYDPTLLEASEDDYARQGQLFLAYKIGGNWVNAVLGNSVQNPSLGNFRGTISGADGSYSAFVAANPGLTTGSAARRLGC